MAEIRAEKEQKKLIKDRTKSDFDGMNEMNSQRPGVLTFRGRMKPSPTFSDIVGTTTKRHGSTVCRKALAKKAVNDFKVVEVKKRYMNKKTIEFFIIQNDNNKEMIYE